VLEITTPGLVARIWLTQCGMSIIALVLLGICTLWIALGLGAVVRTTRGSRRPTWSDDGPPVSVLKPLCGADPGLAANLETFFRQDHPRCQLVFGVEDPNDPAVGVVSALIRKHPQVDAVLVIHSGGSALNPKVRNLTGMLPHASHDLVLISDSNVRAPTHYVSELVATLLSEERVGLVTNLFAGTGERSLGAALDAVQLNGFCAAGAALPTAVGDSLVVGKSMLFSRSTFERLGGFGRVGAVLAEDFVIGKLYQHAGYRVRVAPTVLENHTGRLGFRACLRRHLRWSMLRWRLRPTFALLELLVSPLLLMPVAWWLGGPWGFGWALSLLLLRDVGGWVALRGWRRAWLPLLLSPVRELSMCAMWLLAPFKRHVSWRGHRARLSAGTLLFEVRAQA